MVFCGALKCICNLCDYPCRKDKSNGEFIARIVAQERAEPEKQTPKARKQRRRSNAMMATMNSERSISEKNEFQVIRENDRIELKHRQDDGKVIMCLGDVCGWITSPKIASLVVWAMSLVFLRVKLDTYRECNLESNYRLDNGVVKQYWRNGSTDIQYNEECAMQQNPVFANITGIMIFFLTIALGAGLDKYKETLRMYEEITGDIKAMAMLMVHLTFDHEKYEMVAGKLQYRTNVETSYSKMRYLLASLGPTVKNTLAGFEYLIQYREKSCTLPEVEQGNYGIPQFTKITPFEAMSDRKYFEEREANICTRLFLTTSVEYSNYWRDAVRAEYPDEETLTRILEQRKTRMKQLYENWKGRAEKELTKNKTKLNLRDDDIKKELDEKIEKLKSAAVKKFELRQKKKLKAYRESIKRRNRLEIGVGRENLDSDIQYALYNKISDLHKYTEMDAFECTMTAIMDEIMRLFENGLGFGQDEGSAVVSAAIDRWNAIYATWGTMASLKTFSEPFAVNLFRLLLVGGYSYFMPLGYLKYAKNEDWLIFIYVGSDMFIFCFMWWLAFAVRNPFKNSWIIRNVNKLAYETQYQVLHLMKFQNLFDSKDYSSNSKYGYLNKHSGFLPGTEVTYNYTTWVVIDRNKNRITIEQGGKQKIVDKNDLTENEERPVGHDVFGQYKKKSNEEIALEKLLDAVEERNITVATDNRQLERIIEAAFKRMEDDRKVTLDELKKIITKIMKEIKEFDRAALADELKSIVDDPGVKPGGYGTIQQREADARRAEERDRKKKKLRSRIRPSSLNSQRSSDLTF